MYCVCILLLVKHGARMIFTVKLQAARLLKYSRTVNTVGVCEEQSQRILTLLQVVYSVPLRNF